MSEKKVIKWSGPFSSHQDYEGVKDFDKYYLDVTEKEVFKASGEIDPDTKEELGTIEKKLIIKKVDIDAFVNSQADSVGVAAYVRSLSLQGSKIEEFNTSVDDKIQDFSSMPDDLAGVLMAGENAKKAFANLDPELKGNHTTIDGFLNSLNADTIDNYIKARIAAVTGNKEENNNG